MSRAGAMSGSFELASDDLKAYSRLDVPGRSIQRMAAVIGPHVQSWLQERQATIPEPAPHVMYVSYDGTGVPTTKSETQNRKGKQPDGTAKGREVKLGCVFTQLRTVKAEPPQRDPQSTTYVASFEESVDFVWLTNLHLCANNVENIANKGGRLRWKIENEGFNVQKNNGYEMQHPYSEHANGFRIFYILLLIAHYITQLILHSSLIRSLAESFGSARNFARRLAESMRNHFIPLDLAMPGQIRFKPP